MAASLILVLIVYLALQIGFIGALTPDSLSEGWKNIHFAGDAGPLAGILHHYGLVAVGVLLYVNALVATSAAGLVYSTSSARTLYGLSANRQLPRFLQELTSGGIPANAIIVNFILGMTFFLPFHGWYVMVEFMSSIIALSYITGPVCCLSLRYQLPNHKRSFKLPFVTLWSFLGFYVCTLIVYWTGWKVISNLGFTLALSFALFLVYRAFSSRPRSVPMHWRSSTWMWPYFTGLSIVSYLGTYGGGQNVITMGWDFLYLGLLSILSLTLAVKFRASGEHVEATLQRLEGEAKTGIPGGVPTEAQH